MGRKTTKQEKPSNRAASCGAISRIILGALALVGCSSGSSQQEAPPGTVGSSEAPSDEDGRYLTFRGEYDRVLLVTRAAVLYEGYDIRGDYDVLDESHVILADKFPTPFDVGTTIRVEVEKPVAGRRGGPETIVRIFTTRRIMTDLEVGGDASDAIFRRIYALLQEDALRRQGDSP
jgi:hypothetical protein